MSLKYNTPLKQASDKTTWFCKWFLKDIVEYALPKIPLSAETRITISEINTRITILRRQVRADYQLFKTAELDRRAAAKKEKQA